MTISCHTRRQIKRLSFASFSRAAGRAHQKAANLSKRGISDFRLETMNRLRRHQVKIMPATVLDHRFFPFTYYKGSFAFAFQKNVTTRFRRVGKGGFRQLLVALNRKSAAIVSFKFKHNKIPLAWAGGYKGSGRFLEENSPAVSLCMPISASNAVVYEG